MKKSFSPSNKPELKRRDASIDLSKDIEKCLVKEDTVAELMVRIKNIEKQMAIFQEDLEDLYEQADTMEGSDLHSDDEEDY